MPELTFKTQLAERRKIVAEEPDDDWHAFTLKILDHWRDHALVEDSWIAIEKAILDRASREEPYKVTAAEVASTFPSLLIDWVLAHAIAYKRMVDELIPGAEKRENLALTAAEKVRRDAKRTKNPDLLRIAADRTAQAWEHRQKRMRILGRTGKPNPKRSLVVECRQMFLDTCGEPMDDVVGMLASVVTGRAVDIRDALKPTTRATRAKRDTRKPK
jgi:hypothetical protein